MIYLNEEELFQLEDVDFKKESKNGNMIFFEEKPSPDLKSNFNIQVSENKKKLNIVRQTFLVTEDIKKALKIKAINEGMLLNDMVRDIFLDAIEPKYFDNLKE